MTPRKTTGRTLRISPGTRPGKPVPELPAWKAFVVQFSREADAQAGTFSGRLEHLDSGCRARFTSAEELVTILQKFLAEIGADPAKRTEPRN